MHGRPDRLLLPWDTREIPCDVSAYFPVQLAERPAVTVTSAPVTVIVPTHDHAGLLGMSVGSVLEQTFADIDVVVIGDGVGDDTRDVAAGLVAADARVRFVDLPKSDAQASRTAMRFCAACLPRRRVPR